MLFKYFFINNFARGLYVDILYLNDEKDYL